MCYRDYSSYHNFQNVALHHFNDHYVNVVYIIEYDSLAGCYFMCLLFLDTLVFQSFAILRLYLLSIDYKSISTMYFFLFSYASLYNQSTVISEYVICIELSQYKTHEIFFFCSSKVGNGKFHNHKKFNKMRFNTCCGYGTSVVQYFYYTTCWR